MISAAQPRAHSNGYPKSARLLKSRDFMFRPYRRFHSESFHFLYTTKGRGRLGMSISRKVLKRATARNRVRRLLKEVFRHRLDRLQGVDVHVIGQPPLGKIWDKLCLSDVERYFDEFIGHAS